MTEVKIVNIETKPWWKFWTRDNLQVTVEDGRGEQKTFTIYRKTSGFRNLTKEFIEEKYCTGDQFWSLRRREDYKKKLDKVKAIPNEIYHAEAVLNEAMKLIGCSFDCALVLSKEAEG